MNIMGQIFKKYKDEKDDGRIKIYESDKIEIIKKFKIFTAQVIAKEYGVSKTTILYVVNEDFREKMKARSRLNRKNYKSNHNENMRLFRAKKKRMNLIVKK